MVSELKVRATRELRQRLRTGESADCKDDSQTIRDEPPPIPPPRIARRRSRTLDAASPYFCICRSIVGGVTRLRRTSVTDQPGNCWSDRRGAESRARRTGPHRRSGPSRRTGWAVSDIDERATVFDHRPAATPYRPVRRSRTLDAASELRQRLRTGESADCKDDSQTIRDEPPPIPPPRIARRALPNSGRSLRASPEAPNRRIGGLQR